MKETLRKRLELQLDDYRKRIERYKATRKLSVETGHYRSACDLNVKILHLSAVVTDLENILK